MSLDSLRGALAASVLAGGTDPVLVEPDELRCLLGLVDHAKALKENPMSWIPWAEIEVDLNRLGVGIERAPAIGIERAPATTLCTGLTAQWCPVHGACTCPDIEKAMDDPSCPLHAPESEHAEQSPDRVHCVYHVTCPQPSVCDTGCRGPKGAVTNQEGVS